MMRTLGGQSLNNFFPYRIKENLLWPAYEFTVPVEGYDGSNHNILENTILKLMSINVVSDKEISDSTGLEVDLISFIQSRLFQKGFIDDTYKITDSGLKYIGELSERKNSTYINIYVDAMTGNIIPYFREINDDNDFHYISDLNKEFKEIDGERFFTGFYTFRKSESLGEDSDEELKAWQLHGKDELNLEPDTDEINDLIAKIYPEKNIFIRQGTIEQDVKRNFVNFMVEIFLPEGASGVDDWIISDGLGNISSYFSSQIKYLSQTDLQFINDLRVQLSNDFLGVEKITKKQTGKYKELLDKVDNVQREMNTIKQSVDSPDSEIIYISAKNDAVLYITQMFEWTFFYTLHKYQYEVDAALAELSNLARNKSSHYIIGTKVFRIVSEMNMETDTMTKNRLTESYRRIVSSYNSTPSLFPLFDLIVLSLKEEVFFKDFISKNKDFIHYLQILISLRNSSFHTGDDVIKKTDIEPLYSLAIKTAESFLNLKIEKVNGNKSFFEEINEQTHRDAAVLQVEKKFGFLTCHTLDKSMLRFFIDMEKRLDKDGKIVNNAIILDLYKIYEKTFKTLNLSLSNEYKTTEWVEKAKASGFSMNNNKIGAVLHASEERINKALAREPSSMQATCVAFISLADTKLLKEISIAWNTFIEDVSYIAHARGHGEIPASIDFNCVNGIRDNTYNLIKLLISKGFLLNRDI